MKPESTAHPVLDERNPFERVVTHILALDRHTRWVAFEELERSPHWVWPNPAHGGFLVGAGACGRRLLEALILIVAEGHKEIYVMAAPLTLRVSSPWCAPTRFTSRSGAVLTRCGDQPDG
jgi:hypothetical protein